SMSTVLSVRSHSVLRSVRICALLLNEHIHRQEHRTMAAPENAIASGSGQGLLDFLDYTVDKRYRSANSIAPLSSAAVQIFRAVDGENFAGIDVKGMDVDQYLNRFENAVVGKYKQESL